MDAAVIFYCSRSLAGFFFYFFALLAFVHSFSFSGVASRASADAVCMILELFDSGCSMGVALVNLPWWLTL